MAPFKLLVVRSREAPQWTELWAFESVAVQLLKQSATTAENHVVSSLGGSPLGRASSALKTLR